MAFPVSPQMELFIPTEAQEEARAWRRPPHCPEQIGLIFLAGSLAFPPFLPNPGGSERKYRQLEKLEADGRGVVMGPPRSGCKEHTPSPTPSSELVLAVTAGEKALPSP